jgi:hypothetical protein
MPGQGVHALATLELLRTQREWRVYRHKSRDVLGDANIIAGVKLFIPAAQYFLSQQYNKKFLIPKLGSLFGRVDESAFCSELVCSLYRPALNESFRRRFATSVLPADIYREVSKSDDWIDVTEIYEENMRSFSAGGVLDKWIAHEQSQAQLFEKMARAVAAVSRVEVEAAMNLRAIGVLDDHLRARAGMPPRQSSAANDSLIQKLESLNWRVAEAGAAGRRQVRALQRRLNRILKK